MSDAQCIESPISYCKRSGNFNRIARTSLVCFIDIFGLGVFIFYNTQFLKIKMLDSPKKGIILHPYLPITATSLRRPLPLSSRWPLWRGSTQVPREWKSVRTGAVTKPKTRWRPTSGKWYLETILWFSPIFSTIISRLLSAVHFIL